jgi:flagellar hook assembly protein FlgD
MSYDLQQNYPNPFNPTTLIRYAIPNASHVTIKIYDMLGREVKTLVNSEQNAGFQTVQWNGENNFGSKVASGAYIYMIKAGDFFQAKKMILLK